MATMIPGKTKSLEKGQSVHADVRYYGCESDVFVVSTLIGVYGKCGSTGASVWSWRCDEQQGVSPPTAVHL